MEADTLAATLTVANTGALLLGLSLIEVEVLMDGDALDSTGGGV